jgi:hypothetical protein
MILLALFIGIVVIYSAVKIYSGKDRRLPPASTERGKRARIVIGLTFVFLLGVMVASILAEDSAKKGLLVVAEALFIGGGLALLRYFEFKKRR